MEELNFVYVYLKNFVGGGFTDDYAWSSTESGNTKAGIQNLRSGKQMNYDKSYRYNGVMAVRAF